MRKISVLLIVFITTVMSVRSQVIDHDPVKPAGWMRGVTINVEQAVRDEFYQKDYN